MNPKLTIRCTTCGSTETIDDTPMVRTYMARLGGAPCFDCRGGRRLPVPEVTARVLQVGPPVRAT